MTPLNGDFDYRLRRALHAQVDSVEPAANGLQRILRRTHQPWPLRQLSLMLTECADLFWLIGIRLEPGVSKLRQAIAARTEPGLSKLRRVAAAWLEPGGRKLRQVAARTGLLATPAGRRHASPGRRARSRSGMAWLRPALAVSAAAVVLVAGVYGVAQLRRSLELSLFGNAGISASTGPGATHHGHSGPSMQGHSRTGPLPATGSPSATPSPRATCTRTTRERPSPTPSATPTPSPTGSPSGSPSPTPTATATATASTTAFIGKTSDISLAGHCTRRSAKPA